MKLHVLLFKTSISAALTLCCVFLLSLTPTPSYSSQSTLAANKLPSASVQSYREWKNEKIQNAQLKIKSIKEFIKHKANVDPNLNPNKSNQQSVTMAGDSEAGLSQELDREMLNLSMIEDLAISDYFVGYLTRQNPLGAAIRDVSGRLTKEEVAELMAAYAEHFSQSRPSKLKTTLRAKLNE